MKVPARFIHITFDSARPNLPISDLEKTFETALSWIRITNYLWILRSTTDLDTWRDRIHNTPGVLPTDGFLMSEFNADAQYSGYMNKETWDWIKKYVVQG
jgi:hypothetical protein